MNITTILLCIALYNSIVSLLTKKSNILYCGLTGFSGASPFNIDRIKLLMLCNMSRGIDATGMYNQRTLVKHAGNAIDFLSKETIFQENKFLGHCRSSTFGTKGDVKNAHPFQYGDSILIHNGTLKSLTDLAALVGWKCADYDVDSQILAKAVSMDLQIAAFKQLDGAAAVIWTKEQEPSTIYCYRNDERPLFRGVIPEEGMYLSSLEESLVIIGCTSIKEVKTHCIYKISNGEIILSTPIVIPEKKKIYNYSTYENDYPDFNKNDWAQLINPMSGFTTRKWYRVMKVPTTYYIDIENDSGTLVNRGSHLFHSTNKIIKVGGYVVIEEPLLTGSLCKRHDILYCKHVDHVENKLHCVMLDDWDQVLLVPMEYCRAAEIEEELVAVRKIKEYSSKGNMGQINKINEATELLELAEYMFISAAETVSKLNDIVKEVDTLIDRVEADPEIASPDVLSDLSSISNNLTSMVDWVKDDSTAFQPEEAD